MSAITGAMDRARRLGLTDRMQLPVRTLEAAPAPALRGGETPAQRMLENTMPAATAPRPPIERNTLEQALEDHKRMVTELHHTRAALQESESDRMKLIAELNAQEARYRTDVNHYRSLMEQAQASEKAALRIVVELATNQNAIGEALAPALNLTIRAQEIVQTYRGKLDQEEVHQAEDRVDGMSQGIAEVLRNAGIDQSRREPPEERRTAPPPNLY